MPSTMATGLQSNPLSSPRPSDPRLAFRLALARYKASRLAEVRLALGLVPSEDRIRPAGIAEELTEHLDQPAAVAAMVGRLSIGSRLALSVLAVTEATAMSAPGLVRSLEVLGADPTESLVGLLNLGLLAIEPSPDLGPVDDFAAALERSVPTRMYVLVHPSVLRVIRAVRPEGRLPTVDGPVGQVREADGLEPILRFGALWQRAGAEPIRQTQQGTLYKRDRERVIEDPVLAGPIADAMAPLPDLAALWLALANRVGLVVPDALGQRFMAAAPEFWSDNAVHLPQMIAVAWLSLRTWQESSGAVALADSDADEPALLYLRPAVLLWLATLDESEWVALDDLAGHLAARSPAWDRSTIPCVPVGVASALEAMGSSASQPTRRGGSPRGRARAAAEPVRGVALLEAVLLGAAYPLGLVRAAEERGTGRRVVQLTPLGRYVLAAGPTPPPRPRFEQFLFVQPNFEVIAYRQGLTPQLVGRLSRFAWWTQIGSALELRLTRESILFGLEGGLKPESMLDVLKRHSQRALPSGVVDALRTWATHRERVTYYAAATLIEFGSRDERDLALESWPRDDGESQREPPVAVADRFLLIEDDRAIPFGQFRTTGSRDYRRPPDVCVAVEPDGVSMVLDLSRSDLLVDAELGRFADEQPSARPAHGHGRAAEPAGRRFVVTAASLRRGLERGLTIQDLADWYARRTGADIPPAVRLLLAPTGSRVPALQASRMLVLTLSDAVMLDGLLQHPATRPFLGDRLGPNVVAIPDDRLEPLRQALKELGIALDGEPRTNR
jgi:hypothetical protein